MPLSGHGPPSSESVESANRTRRPTRIAPGLSALLGYRFSEDFRHDAIAGLSVAAVALPVSIAYAQLAGFDPVVGLYSSILPLVAYAIFGTSRQLMVNPDAAACAMIAAAIAPLAGNSAELYLSLTTALTLLTGLFCIATSYFRLGALADFLSKPILVGFLNGVAISIFLGQIGKLLAFWSKAPASYRDCLKFSERFPLSTVRRLRWGSGALRCCLRVCGGCRVCRRRWWCWSWLVR